MRAGQESIRVLVCDDHAMIREGLKGFLARQPDLEVVGEASNGREAVELAGSLRPDVVTMDLRMPEMDGVEAVGGVKSASPRTEVLVVTYLETTLYGLRALKRGALGLINKDADESDLARAVRRVAAGLPVLGPAMEAGLVQYHRGEELTEIELRMLWLVARGTTNREIAEETGFTESAVKSKLSRDVFPKLGAKDRANAVGIALEIGLLRLEG